MEQYKNRLLSKIKSYFEIEENSTKDILNNISLYIYSSEASSSDLYELAKMLPEESLNKLISYFDGATIKLPSKHEYKLCLLYTITFYLRYVQNYTWAEIKEFINNPDLNSMFTTISLGKKLVKIHRNIKDQFEKVFKNLDDSEIKKILNLEFRSKEDVHVVEKLVNEEEVRNE